MTSEQTAAPTSIDAALRDAARRLAGSSPSPRLDAELLLAHALGCTRVALFARLREPVAPDSLARYETLLTERLAHRPVAQLTGHREFWSLDLIVTADVLTPRPETELLVEQVLARIPGDRALRVLDLGTGSGAIALAIGRERPLVRIIATDCSETALRVARRNGAQLGIATVEFRPGDWYGAVAGGRFDLIVANPPYVADDEWGLTDPELAFEPMAALSAGRDGLDALRVISAGAAGHLEPGGWLLLEHGFRQAEAVRALVAAAGLVHAATIADLSGKPRVTVAKAPA